MVRTSECRAKACTVFGSTFAFTGRSQRNAAGCGTAPELLSGLAKAYMQLLKPEKAMPLLARAVELAPGNGAMHYQLGRAHAKVGRKQLAESEFATVISLMDVVS